MRVMEDETPGCDGLEVFTRHRFDDPEEVEIMRGICWECPLLQLCEAFAGAGKPAGGGHVGWDDASRDEAGDLGESNRCSERCIIQLRWLRCFREAAGTKRAQRCKTNSGTRPLFYRVFSIG